MPLISRQSAHLQAHEYNALSIHRSANDLAFICFSQVKCTLVQVALTITNCCYACIKKLIDTNNNNLFEIVNPSAHGKFILVCEHASNSIPEELNDLGLSDEARQSHIAWDLGADAVSRKLSENLDCSLLASRVSRLVYDCNRPLDAVDAIPARSEIHDVPGNTGLSGGQRTQRFENYYLPFHNALSQLVKSNNCSAAIIAIHSFTPVYFNKQRALEIGLIHDKDPRLAELMFELAAEFSDFSVALNQPYSRKDGITHTINLHGTRNGLANVMIEIRNDLIGSTSDQIRIAGILSAWLSVSLAKLNSKVE